MFAPAPRRALPRALRQHRPCLAACCLLLAVPALSQAQEDDPPPPTIPPATTGIIDDKTYASGGGQEILHAATQGRSLSASEALRVRRRVGSISTIAGQFRPVFSASLMYASLWDAMDYGVQITRAGENAGFGGAISYSPSQRNFVRRASRGNPGLVDIKKLDAFVRAAPPEYVKLSEDTIRGAISVNDAYEASLKTLRYRLVGSAQWFPGSLVLASAGVNASQYLDRHYRTTQLHVSQSLDYLDYDEGESLVGGRTTLGLSWHDVPARYDAAQRYQRWGFQAGVEVVPKNAIDRGTTWSVYTRYRFNPRTPDATDTAGEYIPVPELLFRVGQFPGEGFAEDTGPRDFVQVRFQWPLPEK